MAFAAWQGRAAHPLLPPRVVLDRNRGGAYASMLIAAAGLFGTFLFLTYYLQQTLGYSPLVTGVAFLPISAGFVLASNLSTIVLMPRFGPRPLVAFGMLAAAGAMAWLAQVGPHTGYAAGVLGPLILAGIGMGMVIAPAINTGTFGVAPQDAGVASATVTVGQQLGASIGTSLLNTIFASAVASYLAAHLASARLIGRPALTELALAHGYDTAFWWTAGIFAAGAVIGGALLRPGPLRPGEHAVRRPHRGDNGTSQGRSRSSGVIRPFPGRQQAAPEPRPQLGRGALSVRGRREEPQFAARWTAAERSSAPSLAKILRRCVLTVFSEMDSSPAISGLDRFVGRYRSTLSSLGLSSCASGAGSLRGSRTSRA